MTNSEVSSAFEQIADILGTTFKGCNIEDDDHPGLLRLIGAKQKLT